MANVWVRKVQKYSLPWGKMTTKLITMMVSPGSCLRHDTFSVYGLAGTWCLVLCKECESSHDQRWAPHREEPVYIGNPADLLQILY